MLHSPPNQGLVLDQTRAHLLQSLTCQHLPTHSTVTWHTCDCHVTAILHSFTVWKVSMQEQTAVQCIMQEAVGAKLVLDTAYQSMLAPVLCWGLKSEHYARLLQVTLWLLRLHCHVRCLNMACMSSRHDRMPQDNVMQVEKAKQQASPLGSKPPLPAALKSCNEPILNTSPTAALHCDSLARSFVHMMRFVTTTSADVITQECDFTTNDTTVDGSMCKVSAMVCCCRAWHS